MIRELSRLEQARASILRVPSASILLHLALQIFVDPCVRGEDPCTLLYPVRALSPSTDPASSSTDPILALSNSRCQGPFRDLALHLLRELVVSHVALILVLEVSALEYRFSLAQELLVDVGLAHAFEAVSGHQVLELVVVGAAGTVVAQTLILVKQ